MIALLLALTVAQAPSETYRALFLRAAPGRLVELIELLKSRRGGGGGGAGGGGRGAGAGGALSGGKERNQNPR